MVYTGLGYHAPPLRGVLQGDTGRSTITHNIQHNHGHGLVALDGHGVSRGYRPRGTLKVDTEPSDILLLRKWYDCVYAVGPDTTVI